jgi:hypothetical protein
MERMERKWVDYERVTVVKGAVEWMDNAVATFERAAREAANYKARFLESVEETIAGKANATKPEEVLSWLVNSTCNPAANLRLDMAVTHGARLTEAFRKVKALAEAERDAAVAEKNAAARYMLTGARTILQSLKSAREVAAAGLRPTLIFLGSFEDCYARAEQLKGGVMNASKELVLNSGGRLPVVVTDVWTYHITEIAASDDAKM